MQEAGMKAKEYDDILEDLRVALQLVQQVHDEMDALDKHLEDPIASPDAVANDMVDITMILEKVYDKVKRIGIKKVESSS